MLDLSANRWDVGAPSEPRGDRLIFIGPTPTDRSAPKPASVPLRATSGPSITDHSADIRRTVLRRPGGASGSRKPQRATIVSGNARAWHQRGDLGFASLHRAYGACASQRISSNQINPIPPVQSPPSKIFRFPFPPNQRHNSPVSSSLRGAYRDRHGRWDGMRWTRQRRARGVFAGRFSVSESLAAQDERR